MIRTLKQHLIPVMLGILLVVLFAMLQNSNAPNIKKLRDRLDWVIYDFRFQTGLPEKPGTDQQKIVVIDIDEASLQQEGQWPWPRDKIAELVNRLFDHETVVIAFDMVFPESSENIAASVLQYIESQDSRFEEGFTSSIKNIIPELDRDQVFASAINDSDVVLGFMLHNGDTSSGYKPTPLSVSNDGKFPTHNIRHYSSYTGNIQLLTEAALANGSIAIVTDKDGINRRAPLITAYENNIYPSLALASVMQYTLEEQVEIKAYEGEIEEIIIGSGGGQRRIPVDERGQVLVPFRGGNHSFPYISASDILKNRNPDELTRQLQGSIALIGTSAAGLYDLRATPVSSVYIGVETHANIIAGILNTPTEKEIQDNPEILNNRSPYKQFPYKPDWVDGANITMIVLTGIILTLVFPFVPPAVNMLLSVAVITGTSYLNYYIWMNEGLVLSIATLIFMIFILSSLNLAYGFILETRRRLKLKGSFAQYVPPDVVETMSEHPEQYSDEGESRELTALFADIRGFTTISESLNASELRNLLNRFFTPMTEIIFKHRGTIDKYVGDMIMAFWGAPVQDPEHARNAVESALLMIERVQTLQKELIEDGYPKVDIGIGLNTGQMHVGDMGSDYRKAYTVLGDAVNLASRLEGSTKFYGVSIVVGENTFELTKDDFVYRELDLVRVKGKHEPVRTYEPVCRQGEFTKEKEHELTMYNNALKHFRAQRWHTARKIFEELFNRDQHRLYSLYLDRIAELKDQAPGDDWDGVFVRREK